MKKIRIGMFVFLVVLCSLSQLLPTQSDSAASELFIPLTEQLLCDALPGDSTTWASILIIIGTLLLRMGPVPTGKPFSKGSLHFMRTFWKYPGHKTRMLISWRYMCIVHYVADENETVFVRNYTQVMPSWTPGTKRVTPGKC